MQQAYENEAKKRWLVRTLRDCAARGAKRAAKWRHGLAVSALLVVGLGTAHGADLVRKCVLNGAVTFQSAPCPAAQPVRRPSTDELNADRKRRLADAAAVPVSTAEPEPVPLASPASVALPARGSPQPSAYRCDGRTHCSQMRSCSEARYFLANCPSVKMDGDRDGTPCEEQWCTNPFAK